MQITKSKFKSVLMSMDKGELIKHVAFYENLETYQFNPSLLDMLTG